MAFRLLSRQHRSEQGDKKTAASGQVTCLWLLGSLGAVPWNYWLYVLMQRTGALWRHAGQVTRCHGALRMCLNEI